MRTRKRTKTKVIIYVRALKSPTSHETRINYCTTILGSFQRVAPPAHLCGNEQCPNDATSRQTIAPGFESVSLLPPRERRERFLRGNRTRAFRTAAGFERRAFDETLGFLRTFLFICCGGVTRADGLCALSTVCLSNARSLCLIKARNKAGGRPFFLRILRQSHSTEFSFLFRFLMSTLPRRRVVVHFVSLLHSLTLYFLVLDSNERSRPSGRMTSEPPPRPFDANQSNPIQRYRTKQKKIYFLFLFYVF